MSEIKKMSQILKARNFNRGSMYVFDARITMAFDKNVEKLQSQVRPQPEVSAQEHKNIPRDSSSSPFDVSAGVLVSAPEHKDMPRDSSASSDVSAGVLLIENNLLSTNIADYFIDENDENDENDEEESEEDLDYYDDFRDDDDSINKGYFIDNISAVIQRGRESLRN